MKNMKRMSISIFASLALVIALIPAGAAVYAADESSGEGIGALAQQLQDPSNDPFDYTDEGMKAQAEEASYPESLDLRNVNGKCYVTPVKCQAPFGTCWGFAAAGAAETSILADRALNNDGSGNEIYSTSPGQTGSTDGKDADGKEILNLSEKHLAYFAITPLNDPGNPQNGEGTYYGDEPLGKDRLNSGGVPLLATSIFSSGIGPNLESRYDSFRYQGAKVLKDGTLDYDNPTVISGWVNGKYVGRTYSEDDDWTIEEELKFKQSFEISESYMLPTPSGRNSNGKYVYNEAGTAAIKEQLNQNRAVEIGFEADNDAFTEQGILDVLNRDTWAYYNMAEGHHQRRGEFPVYRR